MTDAFHTTVHRDGTVTYWSVYEQVWNHRAEVVPDRELAAMSGDERKRIALARGEVDPEDVLTLADIAEATGATLLTVRTWTHRYSDFPPVWKQAAGTHLYLRRDMAAWLKKTRRKVPANWHNL